MLENGDTGGDAHNPDDGSPVRVATSTDHRYLPYTAAMARSLAAHRSPATAVELTVLYSGVGARDRHRLERAAAGIAVRWCHLDAAHYRRLGVEPDDLILAPQYYRCLLPRVLPRAVSRVLYIDADTLILDDLRALWEWPLDGRPIAAAGDLMTLIRDAIGHWQEIGLDGDAPYFNSGVMVIDLARWRAEDIGTRVLRRCQADRDRLLIRGRWPQHDQYGFNVVLQHRWARLAERWNHFPERPSARPGIVHFLGDTKPGAPRTRPEFSRLFAAAVDATDWAGWRPDATGGDHSG